MNTKPYVLKIGDKECGSFVGIDLADPDKSYTACSTIVREDGGRVIHINDISISREKKSVDQAFYEWMKSFPVHPVNMSLHSHSLYLREFEVEMFDTRIQQIQVSPLIMDYNCDEIIVWFRTPNGAIADSDTLAMIQGNYDE